MKDSFSYSEFSTALNCLRKYKLLYVDRIIEAQTENGDLVFGSALHSAINTVLEGGDGEMGFEIYWDSYKGKEVAYSRFKWEELREIGLNFVSKFKRFYAPKFTPMVMERRLYSSYKDIKLEGTMDFIGEYEGVVTLFDWKTTGYPYAKNKPLTALQLYLYAYLCQQELKITPKQIAYLPFVKSTGSIQKPLLLEFKEETMLHMLDTMVDYITKLKAGDSYPKNPNYCIQGQRECEYMARCWGGNTND